MKTTVINKLIHNAPFTLDEAETLNYTSLLETLLRDLEKNLITCLDANCIWIEDETFYSFIFYNNNSNKYNKVLLYHKLSQFIQDFTDNDGILISITQIKENVYQLNFSIS